MASPDISTLESVDDVFAAAHTLPQIRAIHKSIHAELDEKSARLRSQVGGSYRELLGTADAIVGMRRDNDVAQAVLSRMGARCGRAVIGDKVSGMRAFTRLLEREERVEGLGLAEVAKIKLLEGSLLAVSAMLRGGTVEGAVEELGTGDRLVIAAKVLVLSRLLIKSFEKEIHDSRAKTAIEAADKNLAVLRRKLLKCIRKVLGRCGDESYEDDVLKALSAYSLATNSGARDALWHFLTVRGKAMELVLEVEEHDRERGAKDVLDALALYARTLIDVQALVPLRLAVALGNLKRDALLADPILRGLEVLRLDVYQHWCGDEVQFFMPFIQHDDLDGKQAKDMLHNWAKKGSKVLLEGLITALGTMSEFKSIVELRTNLFQLWLKDGTRVRGFDPSEMLDKLRGAVNDRLLSVLDTKVNKLHLVGSEVAATLESWKEGVTDAQPDLWDLSQYDMNLTNGVGAFFQEVMGRMHGRNDAVSKAVNCYTSWRHVIDEVGEVVGQLRKQRWNDNIEDLEDDDVIEARQEALSKEDPATLQSRLKVALEKAFRALEERLEGLWREKEEGPNSGSIAMFFVRVLRDTRTALPEMDSLKDFGLKVVPSLHRKIAREVCIAPLDEFVTTALAKETVIGRELWEGDPQMPVNPGPLMFMFFKDLSDSMTAAGMDLWSPTAVGVLKRHVSGQICEFWSEALEKLDAVGRKASPTTADGEQAEGEDNGDAGKAEEDGKEGEKEKEAADKDTTALDAQRRDLMIQWFYDICYFQACFGSPNGDKDEFTDLAKTIYGKTGLEDDALRQRLTKSAQEYWKRTNLLFGLLCV